MHLIRGFPLPGQVPAGGAITVGTYDGLHRGHQVLLGRLREHARHLGGPTAMLTFEPTPREYFAPQDPPARLTSFRERWRCLADLDLDHMAVLRFGAAVRSLSAEQFIEHLVGAFRPGVVVVGHDFRFGRGGAGTAQLLRDAGARQGFEVDVVTPVLAEGARISSSAVREALARGDLEQARDLLGRPFALMGRVVRGEQLGRKLGYPTANVRFRRRRLPVGGIYAVRIDVRGGPQGLPGVASIGTRPTVGGVEPLLEAHVFDFSGDLYGREIRVECVRFLRPELRFESVEVMVEQIHRDAAEARQALGCPAPAAD